LEAEAKYAAYLDRQEEDIVRHRKSKSLAIPEDLEFASLGGLSNEMKAKFLAVRPGSLGEAARIEGITPAAIALVAGHVRQDACVHRTRED
jgi:tRNA uridine 5-carboxymethylaminomethyl modification enzyme